MSSKLRLAACSLLMVTSLTACTTMDPGNYGVADADFSDPYPVDVWVPEVENTELPYVPVENPMKEARLQFENANYGLAQQHFLHVTEQRPDNVDAWLGLAASYDQLRRFDMSKKAYHRAIALVGPSAAILNNMGYSYLLQGKLLEAKKKLFAAHQMDPDNPHVQANIELLREGVVRAKRHHSS